MTINWTVKHYNDLSKNELYDILALRIEVFIIEQNCPYQDADGLDKDAFHVIGTYKNNIVCTARILKQGVVYSEIAVGRVVTSKNIRQFKKGHELMQKAMLFIKDNLNNQNVRLSAQSHLEKYYQKHGFVSTGKTYLEDGIPHTEMLFKTN